MIKSTFSLHKESIMMLGIVTARSAKCTSSLIRNYDWMFISMRHLKSRKKEEKHARINTKKKSCHVWFVRWWKTRFVENEFQIKKMHLATQYEFFYGEKRTRKDKNKLNRMIWWECIVTSDRSVFRFLLCIIMRASVYTVCVYYCSVNGKINIKQIKWRSSKKTRRQTQAILERKRVYACVLVCGSKMNQWKQ